MTVSNSFQIPGTCEHRVALFMNEARDRFDDQQLQMVRDLVWEIFHCPKKYQAEEIRDMQSYILDRHQAGAELGVLSGSRRSRCL